MSKVQKCDNCSGTGRERYGTTTLACYTCSGKGTVEAPSAEPVASPITEQTRFVALYHAHGTGVWRCSRAYRAKHDALARVGELYIEQQCDAAVVAQIDVDD